MHCIYMRIKLHFFKAVDDDGPAYVGGARTGDVIYEINGISITGLSHTDIVKLIKAGGISVGAQSLSNCML